ncbi:MAG: hypothetical protein KIT60_29400 [Burkholderiaceae bacterium]|nr:hypothetical protein [Burkholderiaceae bacterium]
MRLGFRHCDHRKPFLWQSDVQPPARWHGAGEGPANYFADTPMGAWAEFLRHEEITDPADLAGVRRSLWVVELPDSGYAAPKLSQRVMTGGLLSYTACQNEARRLRRAGAKRLQAPAAALKPGTARGWTAAPGVAPAPTPRDGRVWVLFGLCSAVGWPAVVAGSPPEAVLPLVRHF